MFLNFVGRKEELVDLNKRFKSKQFEFVVIYGRRRVGKTTLIKKFLEDKEGIYFLCDKAGTERNASRLKKKISAHFNEPAIESNDLYEIFGYLEKRIKKRTIIVLDEFSYLVEKDGSIPSIFQNIIDETLKNTNCTLILCGSSMSMMERGVLSFKSPLYGRKTAHMKIKELTFKEIIKYYPKNSIEKNIEFYSSIGGVPFYLEKFSSKKDAIENIMDEIFSKTGGLYEEVEFLLKEEFREPDIYKSILSAIASGNTRLVDVAHKSQIPAHNLPKYLKPLISLGIIIKQYSILDKRNKKPRYYIKDNYINFWFRFCEPFKSDLELNELEAPINYLKQNFNSYVGTRFEELIREQFARKIIPFKIHRIGVLWYGETEIDIVAIDKAIDNASFIEIKYKKNIKPHLILENLQEKINTLPIKPNNQLIFLLGISFNKKEMDCISFKELLDL